MLMDISTPAELRRVEQAEFGGGRKQSYLTFQNESDLEIAGLHGMMTLLDVDGEVLERRAVSFTGLSAAPASLFTCHLAMDGSPPFDRLELSIEGVEFTEGEPWVLIPSRMIDCTPPVLESGPKRVALIAVAGRDAVCFPQRREGLWICVCGRYNRWRWFACRRCARDRDEVLADLTPEQVTVEYNDRLRARRNEEAEQLRQKATDAYVREQSAAAKSAGKRRAKQRKRRAFIAAIAAVIVMLALLLWGLLERFESVMSLPYAGSPSGDPMTYIDYLETL